jgi:integrase
MIRSSAPQTLREYLVEYAVTRPIREGTVRQYEIAVDLFDRHVGHPVRLDELDELLVSDWLRAYSATRATATVRAKRTMIVALWRAAADDRYVEPPRRRIRSARVVLPAPECWSLEEVGRLVATCRTLRRWHRCGLPRAAWWELAVRVAWDTGLRWGDLITLRVDQVTPEGFAAVGQSKTGRVTVCRLEAATLAVLRQTLEACPRELVCPWMSSRESFNDQVRTLVRKAGIRPGTWKWLRRGSATDVEIQQAGAAAGHLGHAPGSRIAYTSYVDPRVVAAAGRAVWPRSLPPCG